MAVNARTEEFQHIEVFDKPALFTNGRIARDTVPKGWYCYDIRGSDDDPGEMFLIFSAILTNTWWTTSSASCSCCIRL